MRITAKLIAGTAGLSLLAACAPVRTVPPSGRAAEIRIIPRPLVVEPRPGEFLLGLGGTRIIVPPGDNEIRSLAVMLAARLNACAKASFELADGETFREGVSNAILFKKIAGLGLKPIASRLVREGS